MGHNSWGHKQSDTAEQINNSNFLQKPPIINSGTVPASCTDIETVLF